MTPEIRFSEGILNSMPGMPFAYEATLIPPDGAVHEPRLRAPKETGFQADCGASIESESRRIITFDDPTSFEFR